MKRFTLLLLVFFVGSQLYAQTTQVTGFTLIDADTDQDILLLTDGITINRATLPPNLNIRADLNKSGDIGSVRFRYDSNNNYKTENVEPYAIAGDNPKGNYTSWSPNPTVGSHVLGATPYSKNNASGSAGISLTINFTVIDQAGNVPPSADAGADQEITLPTNSVTLNGSGNDTDGTITAYGWTQLSGPSTATLSGANSPSLTASDLQEGVYTFRLTVTDDDNDTGSDDVTVTVYPAPNQPPTADAGADQEITLPTNSVVLNGSGNDTDGTITTYEWTQESGPSTASLSGASTPTLTASDLVEGVYTFRLTVTDNDNDTGYDEAVVTVNGGPNQPPTADAGWDKTITLPINSVIFNGEGSDVDGYITAYLWTQISGPSQATLVGADTPDLQASNLLQGEYTFRLTVTDDDDATGSDDVKVTVNPATNQPPSANAGSDQTITLPTNSVVLDGSGSDPDGTISAYAWSQVSGPSTATLANANTEDLTASNLIEGIYLFRLTVTDNDNATDSDDAQVTVEPEPGPGQSVVSLTLVDADADVDIQLLQNGDTINLANMPTNNFNIVATTDPSVVGSVRFDYDGQQNYATENVAPYCIGGDTDGDYKPWTLTVGSHYVTATPFSESLLGGEAGTPLSISFTVINQQNVPPVADAGADTTIVLPNATVLLDGSASDTDGTVTAVLWTQVSGPSAATLSNADTEDLTASNLVEGVYVFRLTVTDDKNATSSDDVHVTVMPENQSPPTANAGEDKTISLPSNSVILDGSASDVDGTITAYAWTQLSGPATATLTNADQEDATASDLVEGSYVFRFEVTDDDNLMDADTMNVFVLPEPGAVTITGELKKWHRVTLTFVGPGASETATPNPFLDYRMNVTFNGPNSKQYIVPGYFAADGNAANTGATNGDKWRVNFAPDEIGTWTYTVSFRQGTDVAVDPSPTAGTPTSFDGATGTVQIVASDKAAPDFRAKGRLEYVGKHHLRFAETGEYFLKQGADAPENLLAYADFDGNFKSDGIEDNRIKTWQPHVQDWQDGDPVWQTNKGKGLIGAINYLASEGMNAFSFLTMNIGGDDKNVFPYLSYNNNASPQEDRTRFDCSRLDQWGIVFEYGTSKGMYLHFKTQETENEMLLDNGDTGRERKLYYRELIARYGYNLALNWNLGEENGALGSVNQSTAQRQAMAQYFYDHDPYHHHIVIHNGKAPDDLLGSASKLTGYSLQTNNSDFSEVHAEVIEWIDKSVNANKPWVVACDEPGDASHALLPDVDDASHDVPRKNALWGTIMAGGAGNEWYFGYSHVESDLTCQDWRSRNLWWDQCRIALQFFKGNNIPFWDMQHNDGITSSSDDFAFVKNGACYLVFLKNGGTTNINLPAGDFVVQWFDPRNGGALQNGTVTTVTGGGSVGIGQAPNNTNLDWAVLVTQAEPPEPVPPVAPTNLVAAVNGTTVTLNWTDNANNEAEFQIERKTTGSFAQVAIVGANITTYADAGLTPLTTYTYRVRATNQYGESNYTNEESATTEDAGGLVGIFDYAEDIGAVGHAGSAEESGGVYTIEGGGADIWNSADEFYYVYDNFSGDGEIIAKVNSVENTNQWAKAGVMFRDGTSAGAKFVMMIQRPDKQVCWQWRTNANSSAQWNGTLMGGTSAVKWLRVVRDGNTFTGYYSTSSANGPWTQVGNSQTISMSNVKAGLCVTAHNDGTLCTASLQDVTMIGGSMAKNSALAEEIVESIVLPDDFALSQNYPNPFNPQTTIDFSLPQDEFVVLEIYDMRGALVRRLVNSAYTAGIHAVVWNGVDEGGNSVSSGMYFYRITAGEFNMTRKMTFIK